MPGDLIGGASPIHILLVEDNPEDVELTLRGLGRAKLQNRVWTVHDGAEALAFLRNQPPHQHAPRPDLVLLDLNLPKIDGAEVLLRIREHPQLYNLPVVVLTASDEESERFAALAAEGFLTKPVDFDRLRQAVQAVASLGWAIVKLPT